MASPQITNGQLNPWATWGKYNGIYFAIEQALAAVQTATLVKVLSCTNAGGISPVGTVNIQPLVNQIDGNGNAVPHGTIFNVPYSRIQGGANALILDPQAGDLGLAVFGSRDLSQVIATLGQANPGSARMLDFSDALYVGGMLNGVPTQYVQFQSSGISIVSPNQITLQAPQIIMQGNVTVSQDVIAGPSSISLVNHTHTSEAEGSPTSPPIA
jgi:Phage protein Gp138 N-terminal domain